MEWVIIILLAVNLALVAYLLLRKPAAPQQDSGPMMLLQQQMQEMARTMDTRLGEGMRTQLDHSQKTFSSIQQQMDAITNRVSSQLMEVVKGVSETRESTKQVFTIAEQLQNLEKVLKHQKQRGNLGEASLELILSNILPPGTYKMQYEFPGGETVDAIIETKEGVIPIDAKFSLDNYQRLVNAVDDAQRAELEKQFKNDLKFLIH